MNISLFILFMGCTWSLCKQRIPQERKYITHFTGSVPQVLSPYNNRSYTMQQFIWQITTILNTLPSIQRATVLRYLGIDEEHYMTIPLHNNCIVILPECYGDLLEHWIESRQLIG